MLILNADEVRKSLPMAQAIEAMKTAFAALSDGRAEVPLRTQLPIKSRNAVSLFMPAYVLDEMGESLVVKVVSLFPNNAMHGLPLIHAAVLVMEAHTGRMIALLEGGTLTAIRTGAASGAATDILARRDAHVVAILGSGTQGRTQLEAVCSARSIQTAWIYDRNPERRDEFIAEMTGKEGIPDDLRPAESSSEAIYDADIICAATTARRPIFVDADLKSGVHINGVGSYTPEMQEIPPETVRRALVVVDSRSASMVEAGDLLKAILLGYITAKHVHGELGEIVLGRKRGRTNSEQVTFFKSVGVAVQDAVAARLAIENAVKSGFGQQVNW